MLFRLNNILCPYDFPAHVVFNASLCQVDLLRGQKADKVDVTLAPEELDAMENVLQAK